MLVPRSAHLPLEAPASALAMAARLTDSAPTCSKESPRAVREVVSVMSMHKLLAGDGYAYLTRQVAAGDAGLGPDDSLVAYYESTGNPPGRWTGHGLAGFGDDASGRMRPGTAVAEAGQAAGFRDA